MLPTDAKILAAFPAAPGTLHFRDLMKTLGVAPVLRLALRERVRSLVAAGRLERARGSRYGRPIHLGESVGTLVMSQRGFGFVAVEGGGEDVYVDGRSVGDAMHRDRVRVHLRRNSRGRIEGRITKILARGTHSFVATWRNSPQGAVLHPQDPRLPDHVQAEPGAEVEDGQLVAATFTEYGDSKYAPRARIVRVLDEVDDEAEIIVYDLGLRLEFPPEALKDAKAYGDRIDPKEITRRRDLRGRALLTIDPETARDFDDAIHVESLPQGGWQVTVAIADVAHYVQAKTPLDEEARARSTSVYLPGRVIPMLPHSLSSGLCSLQPQVDRLAMVAEMELTPQGELGAATFYNAVIHSHARFTYDRAARMLGIRSAEDTPTTDDSPSHEGQRPVLEALLHATRARRKNRKRRGYLELELGEPRVIFDEEGNVADVASSTRHEGHKMVEEAMLLANEAVARFFVESERPALFRVHDKPTAAAIARLRAQVSAFGAPLTMKKVTASGLSKYCRGLSEHPQQMLLQMLVLRSMAKAVYEDEVAPHFGLGATEYLHFTSPIRRYPDLYVHRLLKAALAGESVDDQDDMGSLADGCSRRERLAVDAERTVLDLYKARFLSHRIGEIFDGTVIGVTGIGLFVQIDAHAVEGLIAVEALGKEHFAIEAKTGALVGRQSKVRYALGDRVTIKVEHVNVRRRRANFSLEKRLPRPV